MKRFIIIFLLIFTFFSVQSQDFNCQVSVNSNQIGGSNRNRFDALRDAIYNFINERKWCTYTLKVQERVECSIFLNITKLNGDVITGTLTLQSQRPVLNSSYKTTMLNFQDKNVEFTYEDGTPLEFDDNSTLNQLTSLIAYYLNLFLAVDFDSFSMNGGADYFTKAQNIVNLCQNVKEAGWKSYETGQTNRYWIIENFTNGQYSKIHEFLYNYHRLGLDIMSETPDAGRAVILESLRLLQQVNSQRSGLAMVQMIVQAKSNEIVDIFKEGTPTEKNQMVNIMRQVDASNVSRYEAVNKTN